MGGVPTKHKTHGGVGRHRSHQALKRSNLNACPKCNSAKKPHQYCPNCGYYKGRVVADVLAKLSKKEKKERESKSEE